MNLSVHELIECSARVITAQRELLRAHGVPVDSPKLQSLIDQLEAYMQKPSLNDWQKEAQFQRTEAEKYSKHEWFHWVHTQMAEQAERMSKS